MRFLDFYCMEAIDLAEGEKGSFTEDLTRRKEREDRVLSNLTNYVCSLGRDQLQGEANIFVLKGI